MPALRPRFITFDCYGTLTRFRIGDMTREMFAARLPGDRLEQFVRDFTGYRLDEVLGPWQPYVDVIKNALRRTCKRHGIPFVEAEGQAIYDAVPTWGPHPDVPDRCAASANAFPLVILSNAANAQIQHNVDKLGAPFHAVFTAEQAQSYKPRMRGFEFMLGFTGRPARGRAARVQQPALRSHDRQRSGHPAQGLRQSRPRAVNPLVWLS